MIGRRFAVAAGLSILAVFATSSTVEASISAAITSTPSYFANTLPANDDGSTGAVPIGFSVNFFGNSYSSLYVNNNGNVTFTGPLSTFTPFGLIGTSTPILAPFFADVDTRASNSGLVRFGAGTFGGLQSFGVSWGDMLNTTIPVPNRDGVGHYFQNSTRTNDFQLVIVNRSDVSAGSFDFYFNYNQIQWETGDASGGANGQGGNSARAGWSNGTNTWQELPGSAIPGSFITGGPNSLVNGSNYGNTGTFRWEVRNGVVEPPPGVVPEPHALAVWTVIGLVAACVWPRLGKRTA